MRYDWNRCRRPGVAQFNRAAGWLIAVIALLSWPLALQFVGSDWTALVWPAFWTAAAVMHRLLLRKVYGVREPSKATRLADMREKHDAYIRSEAGGRRQRQAMVLGLFDTTVVLGPGGWDEAFEGECTGPDQDACLYEGVIRVAARRTESGPITWNGPVVTHWRVTVRAGTAGEAWGLLRAAGLQLPELLADRAGGDQSARYFRLAAGTLVGASAGLASAPESGAMPSALPGARLGAPSASCAHSNAESVDLITGERVAWVCPGCDAELPANWR